jgi:hypothetical protein
MTPTPLQLLLWAMLLVVQTAAFTWVSRARNSGSYLYHAIASVFSNGIWFVSQFLMIAMVAWQKMDLRTAVICGLIYVVSTVTGAITMHWVAINYLEKGKRKVGG